MAKRPLTWHEAKDDTGKNVLVGLWFAPESPHQRYVLTAVVTDMTDFWVLEKVTASRLKEITGEAGVEVSDVGGFLSLLRTANVISVTGLMGSTSLELAGSESEFKIKIPVFRVSADDKQDNWRRLCSQLFSTTFVMSRQMTAIQREMKRKDRIINTMLEKLYSLQREPWLSSSSHEPDEEQLLRETRWVKDLIRDPRLSMSLYKFEWERFQRTVASRLPQPDVPLWSLMRGIFRNHSAWEASKYDFDGNAVNVESETSEEEYVEADENDRDSQMTAALPVRKRTFGTVQSDKTAETAETLQPERKLKKLRKFGRNTS
ncbi:unnamed protein product [Kuraishia capsulata CBS 1993]|uniref:Uncharacterized protein n=1 Tax=Kuraishia capsulata CBS 1993 TaxID=1382522 RepID=W6MLT7_9ASCO|nr:uncharacterized protein KUCA_T00003444001 [Kuraishia capsulata CBS 1993]CDK27466.1 unnamed protein product [Kuraishia capsulata CBS 1993]